ncbi:hypothetical protein BT63DRAFT_378813 [Microthyrium microscopicum]|uniref:GPN-loop GTPase 3 n=1 Tax=Microthyrium microscopicum TaxID=703497 RepID=A0A6A6TX60_9PEZI|nr:hypothetical protein BT63DRAFT_378813 [Microthyrium microscopicum]
MTTFGVLIMGPAGAGKTTLASALLTHLRTHRRGAFYINLDPAATTFDYEPDLDIQDLISLSDAMEELDLGPNGGLIACFEYLLENLSFLTDALSEVAEDQLVVIDMPGQIELYTHVPILPALVRELTSGSVNMRICATYLLEATFVVDKAKFFAGTLSAMSAMLMLGVPHVNVLSKMDLVRGMMARREMRRFFTPDADILDEDIETRIAFADSDDEEAEEGVVGEVDSTKSKMSGGAFNALNRAVARLIEDYGMVTYLRLNVRDEDSVGSVLAYIDDAIQYHEAQEPTEPKEVDFDEEED